jgi:hypothetical protein
MVLRLTSRSPRRPGLFDTVACASSRRLDASIGASEPHDFAVRISIIRPARFRAPDAAASTASRPAFVTCARPSVGQDGANQWSDLGPLASEISGNPKFVEGRCCGMVRRVGWANGSRERAPDDKLREPTIFSNENRWARRKRALPTLLSPTSHRPASDATHSISISIAGLGSALTTQVVRAG